MVLIKEIKLSYYLSEWLFWSHFSHYLWRIVLTLLTRGWLYCGLPEHSVTKAGNDFLTLNERIGIYYHAGDHERQITWMTKILLEVLDGNRVIRSLKFCVEKLNILFKSFLYPSTYTYNEASGTLYTSSSERAHTHIHCFSFDGTCLLQSLLHHTFSGE